MKDKRALALALIDVIILSVGHAYSITPIVVLALVVFMALVIFSPRELFFPIMLFYLPWTTVLKTNPYNFSFFTLVVPVYFIIIVFDRFNKKKEI